MSPSHTSAVSYQENGRGNGHDNGREPRVTWEIGRWVIGMVLAAVTAYFTTTSAIEIKLSKVEATQASQFNELLRRLDVMQDDIRELRSNSREREPAPAQPPARLYVPPGRDFDR